MILQNMILLNILFTMYIFDGYLKRNKIFEFDSRLQSQNKRYDNFVSDNVLSVCFSKLQEQELQVL